MTDKLELNVDTIFDEVTTGSCFWSHKWSKWNDTENSGTISINDNKVGRYMYQERRCLRCNKLEMNKVVNQTRNV